MHASAVLIDMVYQDGYATAVGIQRFDNGTNPGLREVRFVSGVRLSAL